MCSLPLSLSNWISDQLNHTYISHQWGLHQEEFCQGTTSQASEALAAGVYNLKIDLVSSYLSLPHCHSNFTCTSIIKWKKIKVLKAGQTKSVVTPAL